MAVFLRWKHQCQEISARYRNIGVDHASEQVNKAMEVMGGLTGITQIHRYIRLLMCIQCTVRPKRKVLKILSKSKLICQLKNLSEQDNTINYISEEERASRRCIIIDGMMTVQEIGSINVASCIEFGQECLRVLSARVRDYNEFHVPKSFKKQTRIRRATVHAICSDNSSIKLSMRQFLNGSKKRWA